MTLGTEFVYLNSDTMLTRVYTRGMNTARERGVNACRCRITNKKI